MNVEILDAIIINSERHKEHNLRLTLFCQTGIRTAYATGALKPTAKLKGALQLFNVCEVGIAKTKITSAHLLQSGTNIARDINRFYLASDICKSLLKLMRDCEPQECLSVFNLTKTAFEFLNNNQTPLHSVFIAYYSKLLKLLGYDSDELSVSAIRRAFAEHLDFALDFWQKIDLP